jgi:hypothetical protein
VLTDGREVARRRDAQCPGRDGAKVGEELGHLTTSAAAVLNPLELPVYALLSEENR